MGTTTITKDVGFLSKVRWIVVSIQPQQYKRMLDSYPRSDGSKCPSNHNNIRGCWIPIQGLMDRSVHPTTTILEDVGFLSKVRWIEVSIQPQQYQTMLDFYPRSDGSKCPSNHNNSKGCWISTQGLMDRSVHPTTTISKHLGSLIQIIVVCPCKHTNLMTRPTYGGDCFLVGLPDQFPVNISESTERMLAGEWSGRLAGKYSPLQIKTYEITQKWRS